MFEVVVVVVVCVVGLVVVGVVVVVVVCVVDVGVVAVVVGAVDAEPEMQNSRQRKENSSPRGFTLKTLPIGLNEKVTF